jgi:hypothetical protein
LNRVQGRASGNLRNEPWIFRRPLVVHLPFQIFSARTLSSLSKGLGAPILAAGFTWTAQGLGLLGADFADLRPVLLGIGVAVTILAFAWLHFAKSAQTQRGSREAADKCVERTSDRWEAIFRAARNFAEQPNALAIRFRREQSG